MKLETALRAPFAGRVREVLVPVNTQVEGGTTLLRLEPAGDAAPEESPQQRVGLDALAAAATAATRTSPSTAAADALVALRSLVLGYDVDEADARALPRALSAARAALPDDDPDVLGGELVIMHIFADLSALSRNRRGSEVEETQPSGVPEGDSAERAHNPQEYLYAFLRSRDADAEGLPESFRARLRAALAHYGVRDLGAPDDEALTSALYRMFLAHRRARAHVPVRAGPPAVAARARGRADRPDARGARRVPAHAGTPDHRHAGAPPGGRRPGPAGAVPGLRRAHARRRPRARAGAGARRAGPAGRHDRSRRPGRARRRHRRGRRADPVRVRRAAPPGDARGDDAALLPHPPPHRRPASSTAAAVRCCRPCLPARWSRPRRPRDHRAHRARCAGRR